MPYSKASAVGGHPVTRLFINFYYMGMKFKSQEMMAGSKLMTIVLKQCIQGYMNIYLCSYSCWNILVKAFK
jgi:hypothetical protein